MCEFYYTHEIRLNIAHAELKPRREGDQSIMAAVGSPRAKPNSALKSSDLICALIHI